MTQDAFEVHFLKCKWSNPVFGNMSATQVHLLGCWDWLQPPSDPGVAAG